VTAPDDETQALMRKARQAIEDARLLLDHSRSEAARDIRTPGVLGRGALSASLLIPG